MWNQIDENGNNVTGYFDVSLAGTEPGQTITCSMSASNCAGTGSASRQKTLTNPPCGE